MTGLEAVNLCEKQNWVWFKHPAGMWLVGPQADNGMIDVWGQGLTLEDAVTRALNIEETTPDD